MLANKTTTKRPENQLLGTFAFTLAEVLITLGVIGIIAALTIPTLMTKTNDKETVAALQKAYSVLSQAFTIAINENGTPDTWNLVGSLSDVGAINTLNTLAPYLKLTKNCGTDPGCFPTDDYAYLYSAGSENFDSINYMSKAQMADGSLIVIFIRNPSCATSYGSSLQLQNICGDIGVDINGFKGPNAFGKDYFRFWFTKYGIMPKGTANTGLNFSFSGWCLDDGPDRNGRGESCTAWAIYNENLDYLKCPASLSWTGNHTCP